MFSNLSTKLSAFIITALILTSCGKSKDDFAPQLAEDIIQTWNKGAKKGEITFFSSQDYDDIGKGISLHRKGMNLLGGLFGGASEEPGIAEQIAARAELQRQGYDLGLNMGGSVNLKDYNTGFGEFTNQQLGWDFNSTSELVTCTIRGTILNEDEKPIEVNFQFQVDNDSKGFQTSTIKMMGGQIKEGDQVTQVAVD